MFAGDFWPFLTGRQRCGHHGDNNHDTVNQSSSDDDNRDVNDDTDGEDDKYNNLNDDWILSLSIYLEIPVLTEMMS